jgi:chemotaxis methyl-accepting protein methylase/chemotaxis receptor (MCP) glutamine deamidase CheD
LKFEHYQRKFLEKRIDFRMKNLNLNYYQDYIKYIRENPVEIDLFLDKFTINYTYFFRNLNIFRNFENFVKFYIKHINRPLRIWSAPCATGDEPYSIAMILAQLKRNNKDFPDFDIVASDIDPAALKIAKEGIYGEYPVHETPEIYLNTYFSRNDTELGPKFILSEDIKNKVELLQEDITKGHQKRGKYDIIFCRNFFIYINQFAREKLLQTIESRLYDGGLLILGGSETLPPRNSNFKSINMRDRFYIKNFSTQNATFRNNVSNLFKNHKFSEIEIIKPMKTNLDCTNVEEVNLIHKQTQSKIKPKELSEKIKVSGNKITKKTPKPEIEFKDLNKLECIETEVKITGIDINNGVNGNGYKYQNNQLNEPMNKDINKSKISSLKLWEKKLRQRELLLEQREKAIEERIIYIDEKYNRIERERKNLNELVKELQDKEEEVKDRIEILERLTKRVDQREKLIEQKEKQFEHRIRRAGDYTRQILLTEVQINGFSKDSKESDESFNTYEEKRMDRIDKPNDKKELNIPMGYYGLINSFDKNELATKFVIKNLGSGISLILRDPINNIFALSHMSLPSSSASKQGYHFLFPHTFVDTGIKDLYNNILFHGGKKSNIKALIVGGAKLFLDYDMTYQENIDAVKAQLKKHQIEVEGEDLGGLSERAIVYDTINDSLYVKKTWEFEYRKIN